MPPSPTLPAPNGDVEGLHDLVNQKRHEILGFRARNVVDYLLLAVLIVEKLMLSQWLDETEASDRSPEFKKLIEYWVARICGHLKLRNLFSELEWAETRLFHIGKLDRLPVRETAITPEETVVELFHNFLILRNYAAHHDALDRDLERGPDSGTAVQAVVGVMLLVMISAESSHRLDVTEDG